MRICLQTGLLPLTGMKNIPKEMQSYENIKIDVMDYSPQHLNSIKTNNWRQLSVSKTHIVLGAS